MTQSTTERLLSWYGDDFTGSTDALEALATNGIAAVLFLAPPSTDFFSKFADYSAFGIAGSSRSQTPQWMDKNLHPALSWLKDLKTSLCHYKVCSTFDSSPEVGNIGKAIELGKAIFESNCVPVLVGAPSLQRYVVFGNLFASMQGATWRIDRHPVMSQHPVTPMREADLGTHLSRQTNLQIRSLNLLDLMSAEADQKLRSMADEAGIVLFDTLDPSSLLAAGRLLWEGQSERRFLTGSSGIEYALVAWWRKIGLLGPVGSERPDMPNAADRLLVISGSCSRVTQRQIEHAGQNGFSLLRLDAIGLASGENSEGVVAESVRRATDLLGSGRSVVLYTSGEPADTIQSNNENDGGLAFRQNLGERTGRVLCEILDRSNVGRVVIAGGDTSSHAGRQLGIDALTFLSPVAPGAPLCRAWSPRKDRDGLQVVFKGGQCGADNFFSMVKDGQKKLLSERILR